MLIIILLAIGMGSLRKGGAIDISDVTNQIVLKLGEYGTHGYANLAYIYESVPNSMDYQYGKSFTSWIFAPIPRSIWPDKPPITIGQQIKTEIYSKTEEGGGGEGTNSIGELYINFGVFGFVLAVLYWFVAGIFSRKIYVTLKPYLRRNKAAIIIYVIFLFYIIPIFLGSFSRLLIKLFIYAVPMLFFLKIISYHRCIYVGGVSPKS